MKYDAARIAIGPACLSDLEFVTLRMRADERRQWEANTGMAFDPWLCARGLAQLDGPQFTLLDHHGQPFACGGFVLQRPRVWQTWAAAIEGSWDVHWRAITGHCREQFDALFAAGAQRIETVALADRHATHRWYAKGLQQTREGVLRRYFADGSDAVVYARTTED